MSTRRRPKDDLPASAELDAWVKSIDPPNGCKTCSHRQAVETIRCLLKAMERNKATHITLRELHRKVREINEDYTVGYWGFRAHLYNHERELYERARGAI